MNRLKYFFLFIFVFSTSGAKTQSLKRAAGVEQYRPQIHFTPKEKWMNDPNGMVFYKSIYHLFYQYYPGSTVWGPMHWGHATTTDLVHWKHQPVALYPDSLGYIFSGSAVIDSNNTSGFGKDGKVPLVAIFTSHDPKGEKENKNDFQTQSLAYSLDDGETWIKYADNPVLKNPGIKDFRDPKVSWFEPQQKWIMTLATQDHITFFSSKDLKNWMKESEFGKEVGAHGGVWECPDLFQLCYDWKKVWVLLVSINPGGPNGGSATQYFIGQFDGNIFTPYETDTRWIDYGPDDYAGVTWSNTGQRKIFLGWMSNWQYATVVPTIKWRSAMTVPRELSIEKVNEKFLLRSRPVKELDVIDEKSMSVENISVKNYNLTQKFGTSRGPVRLIVSMDSIQTFSCKLSNKLGERVVVGYDKNSNNYYIDRTHSGKVNFEKGFASKSTAPRLSDKKNINLTMIIDVASVELFADDGLSVMTAIFFPNTPFTQINIQSPRELKIKYLEYMKMKSILK